MNNFYPYPPNMGPNMGSYPPYNSQPIINTRAANFNVPPISIPKLKTPLGGLRKAHLGILPKSSLNLSSIISNANKTITTINDVVPLYQSMKPIISNATSWTKNVGKIFKNKKSKKESFLKKEFKTEGEVTVTEKKVSPSQSQIKKKPKVETEPKAPFFFVE